MAFPPKRLARWLRDGITRTRGKTGAQLESLCNALGLEVGKLWEEEPLDVAEAWGEAVTELVRIVKRHDKSTDHVDNLLGEIARTYSVATAAEAVAAKYPELVPPEMKELGSPFAVFFQIAEQFPRFLPHSLYCTRLVGLLLTKRSLAEAQKTKASEEVALPREKTPIPPTLTVAQFRQWLRKYRPVVAMSRFDRQDRDTTAEAIAAAYEAVGPTHEAVKILEDWRCWADEPLGNWSDGEWPGWAEVKARQTQRQPEQVPTDETVSFNLKECDQQLEAEVMAEQAAPAEIPPPPVSYGLADRVRQRKSKTVADASPIPSFEKATEVPPEGAEGSG